MVQTEVTGSFSIITGQIQVPVVSEQMCGNTRSFSYDDSASSVKQEARSLAQSEEVFEERRVIQRVGA